MTKKIYLEPLKSVLGRSIFTQLPTHKQLSKKKVTFPELFIAFLKFT